MSDPIVFNPQEQTLYEMVGGDEPFRQLVDIFYKRIEQDALLRPMFPEDLEPGKHYQFLFLTQYWGGPPRYQDQRGHPRLRMRHFPFPITQEARDAWVGHMRAAIDEVGFPDAAHEQLVAYFERAATFLINRHPPEGEES